MTSVPESGSPFLRPMLESDWEAVRIIYQEGIESGHASFETEPPSREDWDRTHLDDCRFVVVADGRVVGWAALVPVSSRCVYAGVGEVSVYVAAAARSRGLGKMLLGALIEGSERMGLWTLQAGIFPENEASVAMHQGLGFRTVGIRERLGQMEGVWRDVMLLERRSQRVGGKS